MATCAPGQPAMAMRCTHGAVQVPELLPEVATEALKKVGIEVAMAGSKDGGAEAEAAALAANTDGGGQGRGGGNSSTASSSGSTEDTPARCLPFNHGEHAACCAVTHLQRAPERPPLPGTRHASS